MTNSRLWLRNMKFAGKRRVLPSFRSVAYHLFRLPTIILFENGKETQRMKGGDISSLIKITERFTEITTKGGASGSGGVWIGAPFPRGYGDISNQIEMQGIDLLNADPDFAPARTLFGESEPTGATYSSEGKGKAAETSSKGDTDWIESDTDSQLMLYIPFQGTQKVHSIHITSFARRTPDDDDDEIPARPKRVDLFINRSHNLGFEEAEDIPATQSVELSPESWNPKTKTAVIETRFVKFQHVSSLVIFVVDAEGDGERTRVDRIRIVGESGRKECRASYKRLGMTSHELVEPEGSGGTRHYQRLAPVNC